MLNLKRICRKHKGFTLIEVILALFISSIIIIPIFSILDFSIKSCAKGDEKDQLMMNGRYAIEYIKNEIKAADRIIVSDKIEWINKKFPNNMGFVILKIREENTFDKYTYILYHQKNDNIVRVSYNLANNKYPEPNFAHGNNDLCEFLDSISNTKIDIENSIIYLELDFKHDSGEKLKIKSDIYIRCPIEC
jgi:prepilin-type N-terminal cleavage/methylation domain-containing protein